jgi:hypothetical protein
MIVLLALIVSGQARALVKALIVIKLIRPFGEAVVVADTHEVGIAGAQTVDRHRLPAVLK